MTLEKLQELSTVKFFSLVFVISIVLGAGIFMVTTGGENTTDNTTDNTDNDDGLLSEPEPPENDYASANITYGYEEVRATYLYEPPESDDATKPDRVIFHRTKEITEETRLYEFNATSEHPQQHTIPTKELAENKEKFLETLPDTYITIAYENGTTKTVATQKSLSEDEIKYLLSSNTNSQIVNGELQLELYNKRGDSFYIQAPNGDRTTLQEGETATITPDQYYRDLNDDGIYETKNPIITYITYNDIRVQQDSYEPSFQTITEYEFNKYGGSIQLRLEQITPYDTIVVYTPGGKYIDPDGGGEFDTQQTDPVQSGTNVYIHEDAKEVMLLVEIDGNLYVVETLDPTNLEY